MLKRGSLVWGKLKGFPWWPAIVIDPEDCGRDRIQNDKPWLFWFGDHKIAQVDAKNVLDFEEYFKEKSIHIKGKKIKKAIEELLLVSAKNHQFECTDTSALFSWANNGFKTSHGNFDKDANNELPDIVLQALQKDDFKRKEIVETVMAAVHSRASGLVNIRQKLSPTIASVDETRRGEARPPSTLSHSACLAQSRRECTAAFSESAGNNCKVTDMVRNGSKTLEDICIICCTFQLYVRRKHPLFIGGVCHNCKKCIEKINKTKFGKMQEICVICSQRGNLVYCSNKVCLRSFCELCIDYMVGRGSYLKVVKSENWKCYLCKPDSDKNCLIKRRIMHESKIIPAPPFPKEKLPISVIAQNDVAYTVLKKKKIQIEAYFTEPCIAECSSGSSKSNQLKHYVDFSEDEFRRICADLVYGSFYTTSQDVKSDVVLFSSAFFKFLYRLDNAKLYKSAVFFIFLSNAVLNFEVLSRVLGFLQVDPFIVQVKEKELFIWSNIPSLSYEKYRHLQIKVDENKSVEEEILSEFVDPLKLYFKCIV